MKRFRILIAILFVALLGTIMTPSAQADTWDRKTIITFSEPVEIPGVHLKGWGVLPAGTYVFKILDSQSNRHIVQIFSEDEKTVYATILAIPNSRLRVTDKTVITFAERPAGQPEALHAWFYPGRLWGEEFVYPKEKASELARTARTNVLYTEANYPYEVDNPEQLSEEQTIASMRAAQVQAIRDTGEEVELRQVVTHPADGPADSDQTEYARRQAEQREMALRQEARQAEQREMALRQEARESEQRRMAQRQEARQAEQREMAQRSAAREDWQRPVGTDDTEPTLPDSASPLALMALFGFLSMAGAVTLRAARKAIR